jgi:hypothetical protein
MSPMGLDNRAADGQTDSHSTLLRCIEGFEELAAGFRSQTDSHILHVKAHTIFFIYVRFDEQVSRAIFNCAR